MGKHAPNKSKYHLTAKEIEKKVKVKFKIKRESLGHTMEAMGDKLSVNASTYAKTENDVHTLSFIRFLEICMVYNIPPYEILKDIIDEEFQRSYNKKKKKK